MANSPMSNIQPGELMEWIKTTDYIGPVGITVKYPVKVWEVANFRTLFNKNRDSATARPGCKVFKMHTDFKDPSCFWLVEEWESTTAWKPYMLSQDRAVNDKAMMPMMAGQPHMALYKISESTMSNVQPGELKAWVKTTDYKGAIGITVKYPVKASEVSNFRTVFRKNRDSATAQLGCKVFKMHEDFKDPSSFWVVEEWESVAAWKPYLLSQERSVNDKAMMPMMAGPPHMALFKIKN